jgi:hypothetical protein
MAYEAPAEVDFETGLVIQGLDAWRKYRRWRKRLVSIRPELREAFPDEQAVNEALEKYLEIRETVTGPTTKRKKSA